MLFSLASISSHYELGIKPIFCHTDKHYIQVYVQITDSISDTEGKLGFLRHCPECNHRAVSESPILSCDLCSSNCKLAGPIWIGNIFDKSLLNISIDNSTDSNLTKLFEIAISESSMPPLYYVTDNISQNLKISLNISIYLSISRNSSQNLESLCRYIWPPGLCRYMAQTARTPPPHRLGIP